MPVIVEKPALAMSAAALSLLLTVAACGSSDPDPDPDPTSPTQPVSTAPGASGPTESPEPSPAPSEPQPAAGVDALAAIEIAERAVPGDVVELHRDRENGVPVWEVDVRRADGSGVELYIDRANGEVLRERSTDLSAYQRQATTVSAAESARIALDSVGGEVVELELDRDDGRLLWAVTVRADDGVEWEFEIDANSGDILDRDRDD